MLLHKVRAAAPNYKRLTLVDFISSEKVKRVF